MKKSYLSLAAGISFVLLFSVTKCSEIKDQMSRQALTEILDLTEVKHEGTLASIVTATQASWLRKAGTERWEMNNKFEKLNKSITPFLRSLGSLMKLNRYRKNMTMR